MKFKISEIFFSIQGEGSRAGLPCVFVRMQGCRLRCRWCDTKYALDFNSDFYELSYEELLIEIKKFKCNFIEFTGGEPLEQDINPIMTELCDDNYEVALETSGYIDVSTVDSRVIKIIDIKCPDSLMSKKNDLNNLSHLTKRDEVKFVIANLADYEFAKKITLDYDLPNRCNSVLFSPVFGEMENINLVELILKDNLTVRFQMQLHKFIWEPSKRGV